jgi:hypothetical protein
LELGKKGITANVYNDYEYIANLERRRRTDLKAKYEKAKQDYLQRIANARRK